ncbi:MAG: hypothetical protein CMJ84_11330 [Planctomycetes bacterium]|nr:hypothetical protein [Planctomycetota bacterium]
MKAGERFISRVFARFLTSEIFACKSAMRSSSERRVCLLAGAVFCFTFLGALFFAFFLVFAITLPISSFSRLGESCLSLPILGIHAI